MSHDAKRIPVSELLVSYPARLVIYGVISFVVLQFVYLLKQSYGTSWLASEQGPIELAQIGCLLLAAVLIAVAAKRTTIGHTALVAAASLTLYAAARESDYWFETYLFDDAYKWLVGLPVLILMIWVVYRDHQKLIGETLYIFRFPSATMFTMAGILLCSFGQTLDRPKFWPELGSIEELSLTKMLVEEVAELFAYLMIAFSGIEAVISTRNDSELATREERDEPDDAGPIMIESSARTGRAA